VGDDVHARISGSPQPLFGRRFHELVETLGLGRNVAPPVVPEPDDGIAPLVGVFDADRFGLVV